MFSPMVTVDMHAAAMETFGINSTRQNVAQLAQELGRYSTPYVDGSMSEEELREAKAHSAVTALQTAMAPRALPALRAVCSGPAGVLRTPARYTARRDSHGAGDTHGQTKK